MAVGVMMFIGIGVYFWIKSDSNSDFTDWMD